MLDKKLAAPLGGIQKHEASLETQQGLRAPGWFKDHPFASCAIILLSALIFAALGYNVLIHGFLADFDQSLYEKLIAQAKAAPPRMNEIMIFGFFIGKQLVMVVVTILCVYFFYQRFYREMAMILLSSAGGSFVWNFFVNYFGRARPAEQTGLEVRSIPSFPSGHAMSVIICYGFLAYILIPKMPSLAWKWTVAIATLLVILFAGYSRIYQGSHYLTDIFGGYALGIAWAVFVYVVIESIFMKRKV
jgi:undecaprenyl-diphosphatase